MGLIDRIFGREKRAAGVISADDNILNTLRGIEVSPETAMEIPAVSACVEFISYIIAMLPIKLYKEAREHSTTEEIRDDGRLRLLNDETGDLLDPFQMKQAVISDYLLYGSGFIYPEWHRNSIISLRYVRQKDVSSINRGVDPVFKVGNTFSATA